ncbi:MAG: Coniferyl aldehyde dehydrogenase [Betaproteobacteria bacterium ADurb.Bin341]|nr:MAG: Coniferyl aldehyde dehydrogenase [Betaproteobacteria bacterium ADurb.Bin341]
MDTELDLSRLLETQRKAFADDPLPGLNTRIGRIERLLEMARKNARAIAEAISADFGNRSPYETLVSELMQLESAVRHTRRHLGRWMRPRRRPTGLLYFPASNVLQPQPLGVVGVIGAWNYPFQLSVEPAMEALAAGNRVMIKTSELAPRFAALLAQLVRETFDESLLTVIEGDAAVAAAFAALPFDHLLFTGSTRVGRLVAEAAARNLTPVTLELGGKSPAIIDRDCDVDQAARRIVWGKLLNAGQTCVAPDYLLVPQECEERVVEALQNAIAAYYPKLADNPDYTSIVNTAHFERLHALLDDARKQGARVIEVNPATETLAPEKRKMAPTLVTGVTDDMRLMQEEIFGPILPILGYEGFDAALGYINRHDRPLALYWFGKDARNRQRILEGTHSGGVTINDCLLHLSQESQPFGGIGPSGSGHYHGEWGFNTFSKLKPVFIQSRWNGMSLVAPPFGKLMQKLFERFSGTSGQSKNG